MRILHYTLGFAPARSGGLINYVTDLMKEQKMEGHEVYSLYPGKINYLCNSSYIKKNDKQSIQTYELVNSLPLAIFGGISTPEKFMSAVPIDLYREFLISISPDVVHVHTLMGIHLEFFQAAKLIGIPIIYTVHDYFGLAPEPTFFFSGESYDQTNSIENWIVVSKNALSIRKLRLFQSRFYPIIRDLTKFINKKVNLQNRANSKSNELLIQSMYIQKSREYEYVKLKKYYQQIFQIIDKFHFSSNLAKDVFLHNLETKINFKIITITNSRINKEEKKSKNSSMKIRYAYIGPNKEFKGFLDFIHLAKHFSNDNNLEFHTYGYIPNQEYKNVTQHGKYTSRQLSKVYKNIDVLVVPSKWKETFGLIVLEAISHETNVLVSQNVGAKELIPCRNHFKNLEELIKKIDKNDFLYREELDINVKNIKQHSSEIIELLYN